jgi:hypothetical protein
VFIFVEESVMFSNETLLEAKAQKSNYKNESKNHQLHFHLIPFRVYFFKISNIVSNFLEIATCFKKFTQRKKIY